MTILVGTSGWSYDDWVGAFYPPHLKKDGWLELYASHFRTAEINSTYYSVPSNAVVKGWAAKAVNGFEYSVKLPKTITHDGLMEDVEPAKDFESHVLAPLADAGALGTALIQASPYFRLEDQGKPTGHLERLAAVLDGLDTKRHRYAVEFRHSSWLHEGKLDEATSKVLREKNVAVCAVDGPSMPPIIEHTADHAYLRFHGRNRDVWFRKDGDMAGRLNRYDYSYTEKELEPWKEKVSGFPEKTIRAYFNNHPRANAPKNARLFESMLGLKEPEPLKAIRQSGLGDY